MNEVYRKVTLKCVAEAIYILFVLISIVSCATMVSYEKASESLSNSVSCCESIAHFNYEPLPKVEGISFKLDESSDAFDFQSGKSYFKAFNLPPKDLPYFIKIDSYALGETIQNAHIFYPQIVVLDDHFVIIQQSVANDFTLRKVGYREVAKETGGLPVKLEGSILVDNPNAKYILIFTTQKLMSSKSPYVTLDVMPIILPGVVTAIPTGKSTKQIHHSPFGLLHIEIVNAETKFCPQGTEAEIEPKSAITERFSGRDARLFIEAIEPGIDSSRYDTIIILQGAEVLGGTVAIALREGCTLGRKFLSGLEYIYAKQMLELYRTNSNLHNSKRIETQTLRAMAEAGEPTAQFHIGLTYAWGRGVVPNRKTSIEWLKRAAQSGYSPAMLALGMALSGPGVILDEALKVGEQTRTDEFTDLVMAYSWLDAASRTKEYEIKAEASFQLSELVQRMSPEEIRRGKALAREHKLGPY